MGLLRKLLALFFVVGSVGFIWITFFSGTTTTADTQSLTNSLNRTESGTIAVSVTLLYDNETMESYNATYKWNKTEQRYRYLEVLNPGNETRKKYTNQRNTYVQDDSTNSRYKIRAEGQNIMLPDDSVTHLDTEQVVNRTRVKPILTIVGPLSGTGGKFDKNLESGENSPLSDTNPTLDLNISLLRSNVLIAGGDVRLETSDGQIDSLSLSVFGTVQESNSELSAGQLVRYEYTFVTKDLNKTEVSEPSWVRAARESVQLQKSLTAELSVTQENSAVTVAVDSVSRDVDTVEIVTSYGNFELTPGNSEEITIEGLPQGTRMTIVLKGNGESRVVRVIQL